MFVSHSRAHRAIFRKVLSGAALGFVLLSGGAAEAAFNATLQAQSFGSTNWSTAAANGWSGGDFVPTRVLMINGPAAGKTINVTFNHTKTSGGKVSFGIQDLVQFTNSANVIITSAPTLNAPAGVDDWSYTFIIDITDANPGFVEFRSQLFISAGGFSGASLNLGGTPSLGNQTIIKPSIISGQPDLAIVKHGATNANPGQVISYSLSYSNRLNSVTATNVEVIDILPSSFVTLVSCSNCTQVGNFITWHLGTLPRGAKGNFSYSVLVTNTATAGQTFANDVQISGAQADTNTVDNESIVTTTVALPCIPPTIAQQPESATNCIGNSQTFVVVANGTNPLRYRWRKNTVVIGGATNSSYSIASLLAGDAGNYDVIVSNACGTLTSTTAVLTVTTPATCSISGPTNACPSVAGLVYTNAGVATLPIYNWSISGNGTIVGSTTNASVTVSAGAPGSFTVTSTITDGASGCSAICNQSATVSDTTAPTITTCATNITGSANASCQAAVPTFTNSVVASDNCSAVSISQSPTIGTLVGLGTNTVTLHVADLNGNTNTCTASFIVRDTTAPTITQCATNISASANASCQAAVPNFTNVVVATDNCSATTVTQSPTIGTLVGLGTNTVTITATDAAGNFNTCTASFIVRDTTPPTITCPADVTVNADNGACAATGVNLGSPVTADNCGIASVSSNALASFPVGTNTVTWTATDNSGNQATCQQTVIVNDNQPPTITCPVDVTVNADNGLCTASGVSLGSPTTGDNCGVASVTNNAPANFSIGTNTVTWTITDIHNNTANCAQNVIVIDNQPPTISCPANVITNLDLSACLISNVVLGVPASTNDNCGVATVINDAPVAFSAGAASVVWTVTDINGNSASCTQTVTILDLTPPSFTQGPSDQTGSADASCSAVVPSFTNGVTAATTCGKTYTLSQSPLAGATAALGTNTVTVYVVDNAGNTNSATASFIVQDTTAPVVTTCPSDQSGEAVSGGQAPVPDFTGGVVGSDNCSSINVTQSPTAGTQVGLGTNSVTVTVSDSAGNSTNCTVSFIVSDTTPPTISSCAGNQQAEAVSNGQAPVPDFTAGVTASDNGGAPTITQSPLAGTQVGVGPHTVTITVADNSGNSTNCTATFTVVDTTPPTITACATNLTADAGVGCSVAVPNFTGSVTATDNGTLTITQSPLAGTLVGAGTHLVTITVADQSANSTNCTASFTVADTTPPTITCPADKTVSAAPGATNAVVTYNAPVTSDNCGVAATVCVPSSGSVFPLGLTTVSCTVTDNAGLTASCTFSITVNNGLTAVNDSYTVAEDDTLDVPTSAGVLTNDVGSSLSAIKVSDPANGSLTFNSDGSFTYVPDNNFNGTDSFTYKVTNGVLDSGTATVTINVTAVNGAGDIDLYAKTAAFTVNWGKTNRGRFRIRGKVNPRGANVDLTGATMQISINGTNIFAPVTLDSTGVGIAAAGATKIKAKLSSATGRYSFGISGVNLRDAIGLLNVTGTGQIPLDVTLIISIANLEVTPISGVFDTPYKTTQGKASTGRFVFKSYRTLTGVFNLNTTKATQLKDGKFKVAARGVIENEGGTAVTPTGAIRITIGGNVFTLPDANMKFALIGLKHIFRIRATELAATGLPAAGTGAPTVHELPIMFEVPVTGGTNIFETIIELKRPDGTSKTWKR